MLWENNYSHSTILSIASASDTPVALGRLQGWVDSNHHSSDLTLIRCVDQLHYTLPWRHQIHSDQPTCDTRARVITFVTLPSVFLFDCTQTEP